MKIDHFPTDSCPTINDACDEVRLVDREVGVDFLRSDVRFGSRAAPQNSTTPTAAIGGKADTHASATFLVIIHDCSASRPDSGFIRLAPHNLSGVVYHETERMGNYLYRGNQ
jgi:hypothetical protein